MQCVHYYYYYYHHQQLRKKKNIFWLLNGIFFKMSFYFPQTNVPIFKLQHFWPRPNCALQYICGCNTC